jgi:hypothetical protein
MNEIEIIGTFSGLMINRNRMKRKDNIDVSARVFENL